jgi:hypothetical protein
VQIRDFTKGKKIKKQKTKLKTIVILFFLFFCSFFFFPSPFNASKSRKKMTSTTTASSSSSSSMFLFEPIVDEETPDVVQQECKDLYQILNIPRNVMQRFSIDLH